ncbi:hypothetical protein C9374_011226 [Naegleria lovaniensis]|uniref:RGS domain-containing protein n=1 Tax=Naegleria lovaniensis TaxID=51637 RepID=A0AA88H414_NAELO|nr:uncharacterized protein C9374_011226 [Naegleria lovaniensis]KAG2392501.1 hypothetical protein C9374_011226 [Naegleria lovaniensis]
MTRATNFAAHNAISWRAWWVVKISTMMMMIVVLVNASMSPMPRKVHNEEEPSTSSSIFMKQMDEENYIDVILKEPVQEVQPPSTFFLISRERPSYNTTLFLVGNYLTAFVWRDVSHSFNISATRDLLEWLREVSMSNQNTQQLSIGIDAEYAPLFLSTLEFHNIDSASISFNLLHFSSDLCTQRQLFVDHDIIIMDSLQSFLFVNLYRNTIEKRKPSTTYYSDANIMNPSDFVPMKLAPLEIVTSKTQLHPLFTLAGSKHLLLNRVLLSRYFKFGNITEEDVNFMRFLFSNITDVHVDYEWFNSMMLNTQHRFNISIEAHFSLNQLFTSYLNSTPFEYSFFASHDYWIIPIILVYLLYLIMLFSMRAFRLPSIKRRLVIPYLPLLFIVYEVILSSITSQCFLGTSYIGVILIVFCICVYSLTILRYFYLRNLYGLIAKGKKRVLLHSFCVSFKTGIVLIVAASFVLSIVLTLHCIAVFFDVTLSSIYNITFASYVLLSTIIGLIAVAVDTLFNRKILKEKGLRHFLFFNDPLMVRLDLLFISFILLLIIALVISNSTSPFSVSFHLGNMFRFFMHCFIALICGGNILIMESFTKIRRRIRKQKHATNINNVNNPNEEESELYAFLGNREFEDLFKEYSTKEMSIENYLFYKKMQQLAEKGKHQFLTFEIMHEIENEFIKNNSAFELNISSSSKKSFYKLLDAVRLNSTSIAMQQQSCKTMDKSFPEGNNKHYDSSSSPTIQDLHSILWADIFVNMLDTHSRLIETKEFSDWFKVYEIQKSNAIV